MQRIFILKRTVNIAAVTMSGCSLVANNLSFNDKVFLSTTGYSQI